MAEAIDDAVHRERRDVGVGIFQAAQGRPPPRPTSAIAAASERDSSARAGDRDLHIGMTGGDQVDQIVFEQQRRARQHRQRDIRLIGRQRMHDDRRRLLRGGEHLGKRAAAPSGDGSSSSMIIAPSAAARSSDDRSE